MTTEPTRDELAKLFTEETGFDVDDFPAAILDFARAVLAKWGQPQQEAQEPCPTCIALARTVMLDQVSFDRKPDCYGIRQITDDEGVEEWEDIRTSPDVAREEANDMMATGRGEIYEVVPLWTTPQPTQAQAGAITPPPIECDTEDLKRAYAFGWWSALEKQRETTQAGVVPLADYKAYALIDSMGWSLDDQEKDDMLRLLRATEAAHGIKGGQHD